MAINVVMLKISDANLLVVLRDWYMKYLKLKVIDEAIGRYVFLGGGGAGAQLAFHVGKPSDNPDSVTLYLEVDDVDRLYADLHNQGLQFIVTPEDRTWGGRVAMLRDPAGYIVKPFHPIKKAFVGDIYPGRLVVEGERASGEGV
jgi:predicted enzyme related to lactoylglutathione lyase